MRVSLRSTSTRTFLVVPAVAGVASLLKGRRPHCRWVPLMAWGYLQYLLAGRWRTLRGGGGPGMRNLPVRLVTSGPYAVTRNPMYLGHLMFLTGLTLLTRSPVALAYTAHGIAWFDERAKADEARLAALFGPPYEAYRAQVGRWLPRRRQLAALAGRCPGTSCRAAAP
ncbi:MAG: methyltransferase family protein [Acidimicrobiales bacterium]